MSAMSELHAGLTSPVVTDRANSIWAALNAVDKTANGNPFRFKMMVALAAAHIDSESRVAFLTELLEAAERDREISSS